MRYGAVSNNGWLLLFVNGYSSVGARTLFLSCLVYLMSFMVLSIIDVRPLRLASNNIYFVRQEMDDLDKLILIKYHGNL